MMDMKENVLFHGNFIKLKYILCNVQMFLMLKKLVRIFTLLLQ